MDKKQILSDPRFLRAHVNEAVGRPPLTDEEWAHISNYWFRNVSSAPPPPQAIAARVKQAREAFSKARVFDKTPRERGGESTPQRTKAISHLIACYAEKRGEVIDFRKRFLHGRLIEPSKVESWIRTRPTNRGPLKELRKVAESLAANYGWEVREAITFALTNAAPQITPFNVTFIRREFGALDRIVATIDPALSPREVSQAYRRIRAKNFPGRFRSLSEKTSALVLFNQSRPPNETPRDRRAVWNAAHPKWKYRYQSMFDRDLAVAQRRLLCPKPANGDHRASGQRTG